MKLSCWSGGKGAEETSCERWGHHLMSARIIQIPSHPFGDANP